jgi:hypothetical protein
MRFAASGVTRQGSSKEATWTWAFVVLSLIQPPDHVEKAFVAQKVFLVAK